MFLSQLLQRTLGGEARIRPRRATRFEPVAPPAAEEPAPSPLPAPRVAAPPAPADRGPAPPLVTERNERPERISAAAALDLSVAPMRAVHSPRPDRPMEPLPQNLAPLSKPEARPAAAARSGVMPADPVPSRLPPRREEAAQAAPASKPAKRGPPTVESVSQRIERCTVEERLTRLAVRAPADPAFPAAPPPRPPVSPALPAARPQRVTPAPPAPPSVAQRRPRQGSSPAAAAAPEPVIEIRIGRVELRASAAAPPARTARPAAPVSSLEEYLRARDRN